MKFLSHDLNQLYATEQINIKIITHFLNKIDVTSFNNVNVKLLYSYAGYFYLGIYFS